MSSYDQYGASSAGSYGTDANFQANYRLSAAFVDAHKAPFIGSDRIWIGGYNAFQTDMTDYDSLLTSEGIAHTTETPTIMAHSVGQRLGSSSAGRPRERECEFALSPSGLDKSDASRSPS